jgi:hypothetical protein
VLAVVLALLALPGTVAAQENSAGGSSAFGPLAPTGPVTSSDEQPQPQPQPAQQPQPQLPASSGDEMLGTPEVLAFVGIEILLLGALGVAIAREGGGGRISRRGRHARRAQPPRRKRGATHSRAGLKAPPPPPRRRRAKAARRAKAGRR